MSTTRCRSPRSSASTPSVSSTGSVWGAQPSDAVYKLIKITGDYHQFKGLKGVESTLKIKDADAAAVAKEAAVKAAADDAEKRKAAAAKAKADQEASQAAEAAAEENVEAEASGETKIGRAHV